jgi:hypothetical protein
VRTVQITPFRIEGRYSDNRHPDSVKFAKTIEEDLSRRDFTVNAIAVSLNGSIVDPFGGQKDIQQSVIRAVGDPVARFGEDALRMMRAVRFATSLNFTIDGATLAAITEHSASLKTISAERVRDELIKIIDASRAFEGIQLLEDVGLLQYIIPELREGLGVEQNLHHIYTVWEHNLRTMKYAADKTYSFAVRMACLLHDVGKPRSKRGRLNPNLPYFVAVRFKGSGTADGNVVLSLGNYASSPLTKSTAVSTSWQTIAINASTARNAWFERFNGQNLSVAVERSSHTAGTVYIDCVLFQPYDYFLGRWFKLVAGSTDFLRGTTGSPNVLPDYFTFTDSMTVPNTAVTGSRQYWWNFFMRLLTAGSDIGRRYSYLPHAAAASETEADYS